MSSIDKEKIFVELREYHANEFPAKLSSDHMEKMRELFVELEDKVVAMLLSLVNGKLEFVDLTGELDAFLKKVKDNSSTEKDEAVDRKFFESKIDHLKHIMSMAQAAPFKLKIVRGQKPTA